MVEDYGPIHNLISKLAAMKVRSLRKRALCISLFNAYFNRRMTLKQAALLADIVSEGVRPWANYNITR